MDRQVFRGARRRLPQRPQRQDAQESRGAEFRQAVVESKFWIFSTYFLFGILLFIFSECLFF